MLDKLIKSFEIDQSASISNKRALEFIKVLVELYWVFKDGSRVLKSRLR